MTRAKALFLFVPAAVAALAGCAPAQNGFPSLALRPAELETSIEEPRRPTVEVPSDPQLRARIAELERQAAEGERSFGAALAPTEAAVARAGAAGSESWIEAQQALSRLESTRAPTTGALAELDQLALARAEVPTNGEDFAAINVALNGVERIADSQKQRWESLRARLAPLG